MENKKITIRNTHILKCISNEIIERGIEYLTLEATEKTPEIYINLVSNFSTYIELYVCIESYRRKPKVTFIFKQDKRTGEITPIIMNTYTLDGRPRNEYDITKQIETPIKYPNKAILYRVMEQANISIKQIPSALWERERELYFKLEL